MLTLKRWNLRFAVYVIGLTVQGEVPWSEEEKKLSVTVKDDVLWRISIVCNSVVLSNKSAQPSLLFRRFIQELTKMEGHH